MSNLYKQIWDELSVIDVSPFVEKKGGLSYLSWGHAIKTLKAYYPHSNWSFTERAEADGTMMVECSLTIQHGDAAAMQSMWLPVLDFKNKPIAMPNAFQINTARMRCLTKCISMFGLGIGLYVGEDLGEPKPVVAEPAKKPLTGQKKLLWQRYLIDVVEAIDREDGSALLELDRELQDDEPVYEALHRSLTSDQKKQIGQLIHDANNEVKS